MADGEWKGLSKASAGGGAMVEPGRGVMERWERLGTGRNIQRRE